MRGLLFEASPLDPTTLGGAALPLVLTSALACYLSMRRAIRLDPLTMPSKRVMAAFVTISADLATESSGGILWLTRSSA